MKMKLIKYIHLRKEDQYVHWSVLRQTHSDGEEMFRLLCAYGKFDQSSGKILDTFYVNVGLSKSESATFDTYTEKVLLYLSNGFQVATSSHLRLPDHIDEKDMLMLSNADQTSLEESLLHMIEALT